VFEPYLCFVKVRVNRVCEAGINNDHWDFVPGVDYTIPNQVYDILLRAKYIESFEILERSNDYANGRKKEVSIHKKR